MISWRKFSEPVTSRTCEFARSFAMSATTVRHYLDLLSSLYLVHQLQPYAVNVGKRLVKVPKIYLNDSGVLHTLLNIKTARALMARTADWRQECARWFAGW